MFKIVQPYSEVQDKIVKAVNLLNDPIRQTLSPKGRNVIFEDENGNPQITNDGYTIAKNLSVKDRVMNDIIDIVKSAAFKTNSEAGDGTSSTIGFASVFIKEGLRMIENGMNPIELKQGYDKFAEDMIGALKPYPVKTDNDLYYIAKVSSSGDEEIAKNVVSIVKVAGEDGMVFIEGSNTSETEIIEDTGFNIAAGMFTPELRNNPKNLSATYIDVPVLITDKRLYYAQEAETILSTALKNGYREVVIVAADFIGEALPYFISNHTRGNIRVLLVKEPRAASDGGVVLEDLATYLGGRVISDKNGTIVDKLSIEDFALSTKVFSDGKKTLLSRDRKEKNVALDSRIAALKKESKKFGKEETQENIQLKQRIASLTNGIHTIRVGGPTPVEVNERIFRYEDAINATRAAMKDGYLIGGGISVFQAWKSLKDKSELARVFRKVGETSIRQIAENCGINPDMALDTIAQVNNPSFGFNAMNGRYEDLLKAGVIDPYKVVEMSIRNAASVAGMILSGGYIITTYEEEKNESNK